MNCKDEYSLWDNRKQACLELQDGSLKSTVALLIHTSSSCFPECLSVWPVRHESIATTNICVHSWSHLRWVWGQSVSTVWFSSLGFPSWWFLPYWGPGTKPGPTRAADTWWTSRWRSSFRRPTPWTCTLVWTHPDTQTHRKHLKYNQQRDHFVVFLTRPPASHLCASTRLIARLGCFYLNFILKFKLGAFILKWSSSLLASRFSLCSKLSSSFYFHMNLPASCDRTGNGHYMLILHRNTAGCDRTQHAKQPMSLEGDRSHYTHTIASAALQRRGAASHVTGHESLTKAGS